MCGGATFTREECIMRGSKAKKLRHEEIKRRNKQAEQARKENTMKKDGIFKRAWSWIKGLFHDGFLHKANGKVSVKNEIKVLVTHPTFYVINKLSLGWLRHPRLVCRGVLVSDKLILAATLGALSLVPTYGSLLVIGYFLLPGIWYACANIPRYFRELMDRFGKEAEAKATA